MIQKTQQKISSIRFPNEIMQKILQELKLMRNEISLLLPKEDISEYSHPSRIERSYRKALKKFPPVWK